MGINLLDYDKSGIPKTYCLEITPSGSMNKLVLASLAGMLLNISSQFEDV